MTEKNIQDLVLKTRHVNHLRQAISNVTQFTWGAMNAGTDNPKVKEYILQYKELREELGKQGISQKDIAEYDNTFKNLPWRDCGYKIPKIN